MLRDFSQSLLRLLCILVIAFGALATSSFAQNSVTGVVRDTSGAPVSGATVVARIAGFERIASTDNDGRFEVRVPAVPVLIEITAAGFRSFKQLRAGTDKLDVTLAIAPRSEQTTVTATRTEAPLRDTPSTAVVDRAQVQSSGAVALDDVLRQVPGFTLFRRSGSQTSNPTTQGTSLRGVGASGASRTLVLSDGIPLNDPFGGWIYWGRVPRQAVESVEVVRGAESDLYGSDALGGVINVRRIRPRATQLSLESSIANRSTAFGSATASARLGDWIGTVAGEGFHTGGYVPVAEDQRGAVDTVADSEHRTASAEVERLFGDFGRGFIAGSYFGERRLNGRVDERNSANIRQLSAGGEWRSPAYGNFALRAFGGTQGLRQNFFAVAEDRATARITRDQSVPVQQLGFSGQWSRNVGTRHTLLAGLDSRFVEGESAELAFVPGPTPTSFLRNGGRQSTVGVFGQDLLRITDRLLVTLAARVDHWTNADGFSSTQPLAAPGPPNITPFADRDETAFSPRVSAVFRPVDRLSLNAAVYRAFRAPTLNELYRGFRVGDVLTQANPFLKAEYLTGGEAGAGFQLAEHATLRTTLFWNEIDGPVANVTLSASPSLITRKRQNLGTSRARGVEIEAESRVTPGFSLTGGYQFADSTITEARGVPALVGKQLPQVPRHEVTFQARFANPKLVTAAVQGRFQGTQFDDDRNQFELERFFTLDAFLSRPLNRRMELFAAGENLLNSRYTIGRTPVRTIAAPALVRLGVRLQLGSR